MDRIHNGFQRRVWERNDLDSGEDLAGKWRSWEDHAGLFTTATGPDRHGWLDGINFWLETSRRPAAMDGTRASSITGCGSGEHGFVMRSQTRWAGSWRQKRIHGWSLPTGRRRRLLLKNRTNHAQDRERESPTQLQGWLLTSARARRLDPRWLKGGGRQKSAMEDQGTRPQLRVRTKSRGRADTLNRNHRI